MEYLNLLAFSIMLGSMQTGFITSGNNVVGEILSVYLNMSDKTESINALVSTMSLIGLSVGALSSSFLAKAGRRKLLLKMNYLLILSAMLSLLPNLTIIVLAKCV